MDATLERLILQTLLEGPVHGFGIAERIQRSGVALLESEEGAIYPTLYRLRQTGWISVTRGEATEGAAPKVYSLTESGRVRAQEAQT